MLALMSPAHAAVAPADAARLGTTLTPMGAERAGNADGSIPAWTGGMTAAAQGAGPRPDPFAAERPLFSITASNLPRYADRLPEGAKALFAKYKDYRIDVYPTHRTASAPTAVYAATLRNAISARAAPEGITSGIEGAAGGIPFPIPQDGGEAVWNHVLAFWGAARETRLSTYVVFGAQPPELTDDRREVVDFPYYYPNATPATIGPYYLEQREMTVGPPESAGDAYVALQPINVARTRFDAWQYLPGQRRVRRAPSLSYDTPEPSASGLESFDDYYIFSGGLDHYRYTLLGKREMYVPYNNNRLLNLPAADLLTPHVANPGDLRYELHRVWVVDATLAPGKQDIVPHRTPLLGRGHLVRALCRRLGPRGTPVEVQSGLDGLHQGAAGGRSRTPVRLRPAIRRLCLRLRLRRGTGRLSRDAAPSRDDLHPGRPGRRRHAMTRPLQSQRRIGQAGQAEQLRRGHLPGHHRGQVGVLPYADADGSALRDLERVGAGRGAQEHREQALPGILIAKLHRLRPIDVGRYQGETCSGEVRHPHRVAEHIGHGLGGRVDAGKVVALELLRRDPGIVARRHRLLDRGIARRAGHQDEHQARGQGCGADKGEANDPGPAPGGGGVEAAFSKAAGTGASASRR